MKIPLKLAHDGSDSVKAAQAKTLEQDMLAAKKGDWNAKNRVVTAFLPVMTSIAQKRSTDPAQINRYVEAGKEGLNEAIKKYTPHVGADKIKIFALDFIEKAYDNLDKPAGFFARLFGRKS